MLEDTNPLVASMTIRSQPCVSLKEYDIASHKYMKESKPTVVQTKSDSDAIFCLQL